MHVWVCNESFIVDLSGELAESVIHIYQDNLEMPVILVLASMNVQICEGLDQNFHWSQSYTHLNTFNSLTYLVTIYTTTGNISFINTLTSKVDVNPNLNVVYSMRHRYLFNLLIHSHRVV